VDADNDAIDRNADLEYQLSLLKTVGEMYLPHMIERGVGDYFGDPSSFAGHYPNKKFSLRTLGSAVFSVVPKGQ